MIGFFKRLAKLEDAVKSLQVGRECDKGRHQWRVDKTWRVDKPWRHDLDIICINCGTKYVKEV